ncbi:MAG: ribosome maturation factor RimM, partial [Deltaproteobacteria bacterium]|nr:ribosome maturation factor RimM [Deltaproteobacteria bacterium]
QGLKRLKVKSLRGSGRQWVLALEEVTDRQQATELKGAEMLLEQAALKPLEQGEYFIADLPGCRVRTTEGQEVGTISGIMETGAANLLDILSPEGQVLDPLIPEIVIRVDTQAREVTIDPPPGLLELNR